MTAIEIAFAIWAVTAGAALVLAFALSLPQFLTVLLVALLQSFDVLPEGNYAKCPKRLVQASELGEKLFIFAFLWANAWFTIPALLWSLFAIPREQKRIKEEAEQMRERAMKTSSNANLP